MGVVYGDIGTSPLYAFRDCLHHLGPSEAHVMGIASLVFWSLVMVIVVKYLTFILRADNHGEGGVLALLTLARRKGRSISARKGVLLWFGLAGAALLFADGMITPAISVLSAVEGIEVAAPGVHPLIIPLSIVIIVGLFAMQKRGTGRLGALFGPAVTVWFISIAAVGLPWIIKNPAILMSVNPLYAVRLLVESPRGFSVLGSVVLCVTGGEALYADLGHFGRRPIRLAWYTVVFPCLLLTTSARAYVLAIRAPATQHLLRAGPSWFLIPMIVIATGGRGRRQALISGSLAHAAGGALGYLPRMTIIHTSGDNGGAHLRSSDQQLLDDQLHRPGAGLQELRRAGSRLRNRRDRHHGGDQHSVLRGHAARLGQPAHRSAGRPVPDRRRRLAGGHHGENRARRLVPTADGRGHRRRDDQLVPGPRHSVATHSGPEHSAQRVPRELAAARYRARARTAVFLARDDKGAASTLVHYSSQPRLHNHVIL